MLKAVEIVQGNKYNFQIQFGDYQFAIKAQSKSTKRYSYINNLNVVLSELGIGMNDSKTTESSWEVSDYEGNRFAKMIKQHLLDTIFLNYLENHLDLDRELGEWENKGK